MADNFLVSRIPFDIARGLFDDYKVTDESVQSDLLKKTLIKFKDNQSINREDFKVELFNQIMRFSEARREKYK